MHVDPLELSVIIGAVIPLLVALVTKLHASSTIKSLSLVFLTAVSTVVTQVVAAGGTFDARHLLINFAETFVVAIATYYGVYKPTGVAPAVQEKTAAFGVGPS